MSEITRKLATVRRVSNIQDIPDADRICLVTVDGWNVVAQKGLYEVGDLAVYFEIDSFIPTAIAPFLTKDGHFPKTYGGVEGERLKTVRLRKTLSQGLLIPLTELFETKIIDGQLCAIINTPNSEVAGAQNVDLQDNEHS